MCQVSAVLVRDRWSQKALCLKIITSKTDKTTLCKKPLVGLACESRLLSRAHFVSGQ